MRANRKAEEKEKTMKTREECIREEKEIRENLTEKQIDKILQDTFPASDPPAWY